MSILSVGVPRMSLWSRCEGLLRTYLSRRRERDQRRQEQAHAFARSGAALLDGSRPQWAQEVANKRIVITSYTECILGHVYGSYGTGLTQLGISEKEAANCGFLPQLGMHSNRYYRRAWEAQIARRL